MAAEPPLSEISTRDPGQLPGEAWRFVSRRGSPQSVVSDPEETEGMRPLAVISSSQRLPWSGLASLG